MKGSQAELIGFLRRFAQAFEDGCTPTVRVIRKKNPSALELYQNMHLCSLNCRCWQVGKVQG